MRILLIGRTGQLGGDLMRNNPGHDLVVPSREELDVLRVEQIQQQLDRHRPDLVINCAAFHNVPRCEVEGETAFRVNCIAMRDLAAECVRRGVRLLTFSSDYVFGGEKREPYAETDTPHPVQIYGISRLAGEHAVMAAAPRHAVVIRTCGLYGISGASSKGGNFVDGRVADGRAGKTIEMGTDQTVAPTSTDDLSKAVFDLAGHPGLEPGIYHLVNEGQCTWHEFTAAILETMRLPANMVAVDRGGMSGNMRRPLYSVLANNKARRLGVRLPAWRDALQRYLRRKYPAA